MSYFNRVSALTCLLALVLPCLALAQSPPIPGKSPDVPGKSTPAPLASPQAAYATPQQAQAAYDPAPVAPLVLRAPVVYQVQRQVVQAVPVAYAAFDTGCVAQQVVVQRQVVQHQAAVVQRNVIVQHAAVARAPRKVITKSRTVTKTRRGLFGRG